MGCKITAKSLGLISKNLQKKVNYTGIELNLKYVLPLYQSFSLDNPLVMSCLPGGIRYKIVTRLKKQWK